jgi:putative ATPase
LQASHVIHVVGPRYRDGQDNAALLRQAVFAALDAAAEAGLVSVAIPAISAGVFGYPRDEASGVIGGSVIEWLEEHPGTPVHEIRLVGYDRAAARDFAAALEEA